MGGGQTMRMLGVLPPQHSTLLHFLMSRSMPTAMPGAPTPNRSFTSLVPSMITSRSTGSWAISTG